MHTAVKISTFALALTGVFGAAYGLGTQTDPVTTAATTSPHERHAPPERQDRTGRAATTAPTTVGGLQLSADGYTLDLLTPRITAKRTSPLRFTVRDQNGRAVTAFQRAHDKELHLIVASRDLTTYRHLHPARVADGTWSTPVELERAGDYRVFADFVPDTPGARGVTLGADLAVSGDYDAARLPRPSATATVDGYTVTLDGELRAGARETLRLRVDKDGRPVTDLQPYLEAYGHLVALRSGDLGYLHVHPQGHPGDGSTAPGPEIAFSTTAPSAGSYRLFLDFRHEDVVRTAAFTVRVGPAGASPSPRESAPARHGDHTH